MWPCDSWAWEIPLLSVPHPFLTLVPGQEPQAFGVVLIGKPLDR